MISTREFEAIKPQYLPYNDYLFYCVVIKKTLLIIGLLGILMYDYCHTSNVIRPSHYVFAISFGTALVGRSELSFIFLKNFRLLNSI